MSSEPTESSPRTPWNVHALTYAILTCVLAGALAGHFLYPLKVGESAAIDSSPAGGDDSAGSSEDLAAGVHARIDPNTATVEEWTRLPGVGERLARKIVAYRDEQRVFVTPRPSEGVPIVFRTATDLKVVPGLNAALIERIVPHLAFPGASGE